MKNYYDVIIVGAGIAGLECAKNLAGSNLDILVIERNINIGEKVCAEGIVLQDLEYIAEEDKNFDFQKIIFYYNKRTKAFPKYNNIITTINRKNLIQKKVNYLKKFNNIEFLIGYNVSEVLLKNFLKLSNGRILRFKFLVGADGSISMVRKYLGLPTNKVGIAIQYTVPKIFDNFEFYLDDKNLGTGYLWVFPNKDYNSIGCGSDLNCINVKKMKSYLENWLKVRNINFSEDKFQAAIINYDYRGYKFNNIFLAGDAAGLTSGVTGKGIYSAFLSGKQIAKEILGIAGKTNLIEEWLIKKKKQEMFMFLLRNRFLRKVSLLLGIRLLSFNFFEKILMKLFIK